MAYVNAYVFRHRDAIFRESLYQRYISQHAKICSAPSYTNNSDVKILKYMKLMKLILAL
jgi:hypothetical protein